MMLAGVGRRKRLRAEETSSHATRAERRVGGNQRSRRLAPASGCDKKRPGSDGNRRRLLRQGLADTAQVMPAMPHRVVLEEELAGERRVEVERDRRRTVEVLVPEPADGLRR